MRAPKRLPAAAWSTIPPARVYDVAAGTDAVLRVFDEVKAGGVEARRAADRPAEQRLRAAAGAGNMPR